LNSLPNTSKLFLVLVSLLLVLPVAEALDAGDTIAFLLGLAVSVVGFCACLGLYSYSIRTVVCLGPVSLSTKGEMAQPRVSATSPSDLLGCSRLNQGAQSVTAAE
uniref:Uncharacterized protein n=1 Tax=Cyanistes caeruleus TaxID=156563 RepID=A0A8C0U4S5_CYACU